MFLALWYLETEHCLSPKGVFDEMSVKILSSLIPLAGLCPVSIPPSEKYWWPTGACLFSCRWHHIESLLNGGITITVNFWYKVNMGFSPDGTGVR